MTTKFTAASREQLTGGQLQRLRTAAIVTHLRGTASHEHAQVALKLYGKSDSRTVANLRRSYNAHNDAVRKGSGWQVLTPAQMQEASHYLAADATDFERACLAILWQCAVPNIHRDDLTERVGLGLRFRPAMRCALHALFRSTPAEKADKLAAEQPLISDEPVEPEESDMATPTEDNSIVSEQPERPLPAGADVNRVPIPDWQIHDLAVSYEALAARIDSLVMPVGEAVEIHNLLMELRRSVYQIQPVTQRAA